MKNLRRVVLAMLVVFVCGSVTNAAIFGRRARGGRGGITVRSPGGGTYTWYGPGGVVAARRAAARYRGFSYTLQPNTTPVQQDIEQKRSLRFATFPTVPARQ